MKSKIKLKEAVCECCKKKFKYVRFKTKVCSYECATKYFKKGDDKKNENV